MECLKFLCDEVSNFISLFWSESKTLENTTYQHLSKAEVHVINMLDDNPNYLEPPAKVVNIYGDDDWNIV